MTVTTENDEQVAVSPGTPEGPSGNSYPQRYRDLSDTEISQLKPTETATLTKIVRSLNRIGPARSSEWYTRTVHKLTWFLKAGYRLDETVKNSVLDATTLVRLYSEVTPNEMQMSDRVFFSTWSDQAAHIRLRIRIEKGVIADASGKILVRRKQHTREFKNLICIKCGEVFPAINRRTKKCAACGGPPDPSKRYCALGEKCFRSEKGHPHECLSRSPYCSQTCLGSFQAAVKRSRNANCPQPSSQMVLEPPSQPSVLADF